MYVFLCTSVGVCSQIRSNTCIHLSYYASKFSPYTKKEYINLRVFDLHRLATSRINLLKVRKIC